MQKDDKEVKNDKPSEAEPISVKIVQDNFIDKSVCKEGVNNGRQNY